MVFTKDFTKFLQDEGVDRASQRDSRFTNDFSEFLGDRKRPAPIDIDEIPEQEIPAPEPKPSILRRAAGFVKEGIAPFIPTGIFPEEGREGRALLPEFIRSGFPKEEIEREPVFVPREGTEGLTSFVSPPFGKIEKRFKPEAVAEATQMLETAFLPITAPITIAANLVVGIVKNDPTRAQAIANIIRLNPQPGDQLFVSDVLKAFGVTDESTGLPEGTIDRIGFIGDFVLFGGVAKLNKFIAKTLRSKDPAKIFNRELKVILEDANAKTLKIPRTATEKAVRRQEELLKKKFSEPVLKSIKRHKEKTGKELVGRERPVGQEGFAALQRGRQGAGRIEPEVVLKKEPGVVGRQGTGRIEPEFARQGQPIKPKPPVTVERLARTPSLAGRILQNTKNYSPTEVKFAGEEVLRNSSKFGKSLVNRAKNVFGEREANIVRSMETDSPLKPEGLTSRLFSKEQAAVFFKGAKNKFTTRADLEAALRSANKKLNNITIGIDPTVIKDIARAGLFYIEAGMRSFAEWTKTMINHFGERIKPHLKKIWEDESGFLRIGKGKPSKLKQVFSELDEYKKLNTGIRGRWIALREHVQDSFIRVNKLQRIVEKGGTLPDDINIEQARRLFDGRVHTRITEIKNATIRIDRDIVSTARKLGRSDDEVTGLINSFLHARHAPERNAQLGKAAAGFTNEQAGKILATIEKLPAPYRNEVKRIANEISILNRATLKTLLDSEIIDQKLFNLLTKIYKNHVPLNRVLKETDDVADVLAGKGFDVRGTGLKRAVGSDKPVADILTNVVANAEQAVIRAEKNLVDLTTLRFARANKQLGLFEELKPKVIGTGVGGRPIFKQVTDPLVLSLRENGKQVLLRINDQRLAFALKGVNTEQMPSLIRGIAFFTRLFASLHTRFNYEFAFSNNVRDIQEMMVDIASRKGMGFGSAIKAFKKDPQSKKAIFDYLMGRDTVGSRLYKQMKLDGGTTGGLGLSTRANVELNIEKIRRISKSSPRRAAVKAVEIVDKWNTLFEDGTRLSVYRTALERGLSRKNAASLAKEASINFNKKGTAGPIINGLYMFSNASIQGTTKMLRAMKNPKVAAAVIGSMGSGIYAANSWNDHIDPNWRDKVTKFDRSSNLVIMLPSEKEDASYITIPISWGLKPIKVGLEYIYDLSTGHGDLKDAVIGLSTAVLESYNPLAGDEDIIRTLTPTLLKVPVEISSNRAWYGNRIRPDYDKSIPRSAQYFPSLADTLTGRIAISATEKISEVSRNAIEISPADAVYAFNQYTGGAGRSVTKIVNTVTAIGRSESPAMREVPVLSRFLKDRPEDRVLSSLYFSEKERVDKKKAREKVSAIRRLTPIYEEAQMLIEEDKLNEAKSLVDGLSDEDYKIYKTMKATDRRRQTTTEQIKMFSTVKKVQELIEKGNKTEAQGIVNKMSDAEYKIYKRVKSQLGLDTK